MSITTKGEHCDNPTIPGTRCVVPALCQRHHAGSLGAARRGARRGCAGHEDGHGRARRACHNRRHYRRDQRGWIRRGRAAELARGTTDGRRTSVLYTLHPSSIDTGIHTVTWCCVSNGTPAFAFTHFLPFMLDNFGDFDEPG